ncbi:related to nonphototropic hypocotyl protein 1 [Phialocephala subalpina]|uniref:Related to nonphototropic hypocotyl protein 1 n=1 Tax=Phialocephala subalpina TaxID=576137 RepID=A0A1L7XAV7_9HELO|nr:related to nonphototropic hypocotyl protein 1 [Phialocephala subalpina]
MAYPPSQQMSDSIDQVIQSQQSLSNSQHVNTRDGPQNSSNISVNRTAPLPPVSENSGSPRRNNNSMRSESQTSHEDRRLGSSGRGSQRESPKQTSMRQSDGSSNRSGNTTVVSSAGQGNVGNMADFFSWEVFQIVLHNPTTAHRFLRFCQSRACGENIEFLQQVDKYNRLLDEVTQTLASIHKTYTSPDAPRQVNISHHHLRRVSADIRQATQFTLPALDSIFIGAQEHVEKLLASDIYPRFVKHQVTAQATMALADHRERFQGLGDCFCLTDPSIADNPILYASDGFVAVTGYARKDIIPRNCRFLQGDQTDTLATKRLRASINSCEETVELLLNYRKNGDPFWNLLYVSPLLNERGEVSFFLGGQINCSTTIHSCTDVLRVLSVNDDELDKIDEMSRSKPPSVRSQPSTQGPKPRSAFFKSWRKYNASSLPVSSKVRVREEAGMEQELINRVGKLSFRTQVEAFYTAYSKYLVMTWNAQTQALLIQHYSPGTIDMLCLNLPNGSIAPIYNKDIFKVLSEHTSSPSSSSASKAFRSSVREALKVGKAVSVETGLLTGFEERKGGGWFGGREDGMRRVEERYVTHWTPLKDEEGRVRWVVLTIAPKI